MKTAIKRSEIGETSSVMFCSCIHAAQDQIHGPGKRVFNKTKQGTRESRWRCTVCGTERG